jgi:hypothetical protein
MLDFIGRTQEEAKSPRFAFVLYRSPPTVDVVAIGRAHAELNLHAPALVSAIAEPSDEANVPTFNFADGRGEILLFMMPFAIPTGEAEAAAVFSVSRFSDTSVQPMTEHGAHAVVRLQSWQGSTPQDELMRLTWGVAAVAKATGALAVYWGNGGVTHPADFFISRATNSGGPGDSMLVDLWLGISVASERGGASFLTRGVHEQFALPDLKLWSPEASTHALVHAFDLISYVIDRGTPIAAGETVGSTADERLVVRYEFSPIGKAVQVMCVDLPDKRG